MRRSEWVLVAAVYGCLVMGAMAATVAMGWQNEGMALIVATFLALQLTAYLCNRHSANTPPMGFRLLLGVVFAGVFAVTGVVVHWLWDVFMFPAMLIPLHALGAGVTPLIMLNVFFRVMRVPPARQDAPLPRTKSTAILGAAVALMVGAAVWAQLAPPRGADLVEQKFPGFSIALPRWLAAAEDAQQYERGSYKIDSPEGYGRSIRIRWETGDVPEEILDQMWREGGMKAEAKEAVTVAGHAASRQFVSSESKRVFRTTWRCPEDQRWFCVMTFLDQPKQRLLAMHESIMASVHCHTEGRRAPQAPLYATFAPPEGWERAPKKVADIGFLGPRGELVVVSEGTVGVHEMTRDNLPDEVIRTVTKSMLLLESTGPVRRETVTDQHGHPRKVWSVSGKGADGVVLQAESMAWYCPVRNGTFMVWFITQEPHEMSVGTSVLLRAECH